MNTATMSITTDASADKIIWKQIEVSESYLVCSMYEEATSIAISILKHLQDDSSGVAMQDMWESAAMVLVQSLNQLGRAPDILNQLRSYFTSVKTIPSQVLLTGVCFQIAEGSISGIREFLEEFLNGWNLGDGQYVAVIAEAKKECGSKYNKHLVLGIDEYLEVVEVYAVTLLATLLKDVDLAISWVENASLPEENRQGLRRRLNSMHCSKSAKFSQVSSPTSDNAAYSVNEQNVCEGSHKSLNGKDSDNRKYGSKIVPRLAERIEPCFWCFRAINLKFGNTKFVISSGKIILSCLFLFIYYVYRRKQATIKRMVRTQVTAMKRALVDLWQLAFSYEVNPLAAVQPIAAAANQGR
ncbi:protein APEM9 [Arachis duranensis]|uniref:Protein APEM9 n=1 Tax=Arachis duranensis TaxID=130453 RepID=A0A6P5MLT7_ARADU|nr:protein APEM9 [Arachis duranensis]